MHEHHNSKLMPKSNVFCIEKIGVWKTKLSAGFRGAKFDGFSAWAANQTGTTMRFIGSLLERLQRWIAGYKMALTHADVGDRRRSIIGELRRRSLDA
jgi:hypothetical protein